MTEPFKGLQITPEERAAMALKADVPSRPSAAYVIGSDAQDPSLQMDPSTGRAFLASERESEGVRQKGRLPTTLVELRQGLDNRARQASMVHPQDRQGMMGTSASQGQRPAPTRPPNPEDLLQQANAMLAQQHDQNAAQLAAGPATGNRDDAGGKLPDWLTQEMEKDKTSGLDI
jgi:hypothetical protein